MYQYLRAIGLGKYNTKKKIRELTDYVKENAVRRDSYQLNEEEELIIYEKEFGEAVGVAVAEIAGPDYSEKEFFFPFATKPPPSIPLIPFSLADFRAKKHMRFYEFGF